MKKIQRLLAGSRPAQVAENILYTDYRQRILFWVAVTVVVMLLPFAINNLIQGRSALGLATLGVVMVFGVQALAISRHRPLPVLQGIVFILLVASLGLSVIYQGVIGVLWTYPAVILFHFVLQRRIANLINAVLVTTITVLAHRYLGMEIALRVFITLFLTITFANIFLSIVNRLQERLHELATHDALTGAYNRGHMEHCLLDALERHRRFGHPVSILMLDVDHFKRINDELGHSAGDRVLKKIAECIRESLRQVDQLFRIGGEEFLVILPETALLQAQEVAMKLCKHIDGKSLVEGRPLTVSLGVAGMKGAESIDDLFARCDRALYRAKSEGRNRVVVAEDE